MELGKVICVPDGAEAAARDEAMAAAVGPEPMDAPALPGLAAGLIHPSSPHAGQVWIQPTSRAVTSTTSTARVGASSPSTPRRTRSMKTRGNGSTRLEGASYGCTHPIRSRVAGSPSTTRRTCYNAPISISTEPQQRQRARPHSSMTCARDSAATHSSLKGMCS